MKKHYTEPELLVEKFEIEDIITTSGGGDDDLGDAGTPVLP